MAVIVRQEHHSNKVLRQISSVAQTSARAQVESNHQHPWPNDKSSDIQTGKGKARQKHLIQIDINGHSS